MAGFFQVFAKKQLHIQIQQLIISNIMKNNLLKKRRYA